MAFGYSTLPSLNQINSPPNSPLPPLSLKSSTLPVVKHIPRLYNKRIRAVLPFLLLVICLYKSVVIFLTTNINQAKLELQALEYHNSTVFNPKDIAFDLYNYVIEQDHSMDSRIGDSRGIFFHWDDWVDLSSPMLNQTRQDYPLGAYCDPSLVKYGSVSGHRLESYETKIHRGAVNLYCLHPLPDRIVIATDESLIEVPVIGKKRFGGKSEPVSTDQLVSKMKHLESTNYTRKAIVHLQREVDIKTDDFVFNPDVEIKNLQQKQNDQTITREEVDYLEFLQYSNELVEHSDRYFKYPWIYTDVLHGKSHHIAYPFFKRYISDRERQSVLHHIARAWFQFAEVNGFASWINHGSLLGWTFNGLNMPWDTDIDIQMPIAQVDRLGRFFNRSLIMENPRFGNGRYWLEVAPTYTRQGNGRNFIDARFIDIHSGLYIDISALSHDEPITKLDDLSSISVHCKNWNEQTLDELLPIRHTYFEGASVYIPHKVKQPLMEKYGPNVFEQFHFQNHNYQPDISLWVKDQICVHPPTERFDQHHHLTKKGACNSNILLDEYNIAKECTQRHRELNHDIDHPEHYAMDELPIFRKDAWDYYYDINHRLVDNDNWYIRQVVN